MHTTNLEEVWPGLVKIGPIAFFFKFEKERKKRGGEKEGGKMRGRRKEKWGWGGGRRRVSGKKGSGGIKEGINRINQGRKRWWEGGGGGGKKSTFITIPFNQHTKELRRNLYSMHQYNCSSLLSVNHLIPLLYLVSLVSYVLWNDDNI